MRATAALAAFVGEIRYEDLPAAVRDATKRILLDTIGCILGAAPSAPGQAVKAIVGRHGSGPCTVLGTGQTTSAFAAAYANGRLANALDFDECYMVQGHHAQATLGAALALCEQADAPGTDLIAAFAIGFETGIRFGSFLGPRVTVGPDGRALGWSGLAGPGQGAYAACAATAHLMRLDAPTISQAFGLCAQYMPGRDWNRHWGQDPELGTIKYADTGWNAEAGMMAAHSAAGGVTGIRDVFDRESFADVFRGAKLERGALIEGLGTRWSVGNTSFKLWPCCRWIHYPLTAFQQLLDEERIAAGEIESVELGSFPMIPYPCFSNPEPRNLVDAGFSFPHAAAMVALGVPPGPAWFAPEQMTGERARELRSRVSLTRDPRGDDPAAWGIAEGVLKVPSHAVVRARGRRCERRSDYALGDPWPGAPRYGGEDLEEKFRRQACAAAGEAKRAAIDDAIGRILGLEKFSVREMVASIRGVV
jgi:2-methylcitrate dehydratase PrpD